MITARYAAMIADDESGELAPSVLLNKIEGDVLEAATHGLHHINEFIPDRFAKKVAASLELFGYAVKRLNDATGHPTTTYQIEWGM